jgi:hypothetical protein
MSGLQDDADRLATRYCEIRDLLDSRQIKDSRDLVRLVFEEMLRAQLLFPGPSLYADI